MKKVIFSWLLSAMFISTAMAQFGATRTGFEGDNFSLEGALELFKDSRSIQDFERRLNTRTNWVNNLDLDYNGRTDYIRVNHRRQGNLNAVILQVPVNRRDIQDIAVIQIEQIGRRNAVLQMVGDEDLYGQNVIIEPFDEFDREVNVYRWRVVRNMLDRFGNTYASPYAFNNYPVWYSPWNQYAWSAYQPRIVSFGRYYRVSPFNRLSNVYGFYSPYRAYCPVVRRRTAQIRSQRPIVNQATVTRSTTPRANRTTTQTRTRATTRPSATTRTSSRATSTRATSTRETTSRATTSRATTTRPSTTRATTNRTRATNQPTATSRRSTTSTRRSSTPVTRKPTVRRSTPSRTTASPRTSRPTTTRATTQTRRPATSTRPSTVKRSTAKPAVRAKASSTRSKRIIKE